MSLIDDVIADALQGVELARKGLDLVRTFVPEVAPVDWTLTGIYEALVVIRSMRAHATDEDIRAAIIAKMQLSIQELAAAKFGALPPGEGG